jgi:hypothetical protein
MRIHTSLYQSQALFIGTLDTVYANLRLEDVWYLNGKALFQEPFSKRYDALQTFSSSLFVQDKHFSGFTVDVAKLARLSELRKIVESKEFYSLDFVPEHGGRRRWHLPLAFTHKQVQAEDAPFQEKGPEKTVMEKVIPAQKATASPSQEKHTHAIARKIVGMPDTYALQSKTNIELGRAAVQTAGVSMLLRNEFVSKKKESVSVSIQWYEEFQRYKIIGVLEN